MRNINTFLLCVYWMNYGITGIRLLGCGSNGLSEVSEKSNFTLTCDGFDANDRVEWEADNNKGNTFPAGTCPCCTCTDTLPGLPVSRTTATVSQLTVMSSRTWDNYNISCFINNISSEKKSCRIYAMYPADVTSCSVDLISGSWTINGSCAISKVFTSSNIYKCMWYRGTSQMSQATLITTTTYTPVIHSDPNYRQGTCTFTTAFDLPLVTGSYYYKVVVYPGGTEKQFGPLVIERPVEPTIVCTPSPYVQENTNINCNCKTTNVGKPGGYLSWSRESNGKINIINNGSYSGTSLNMNPQVLNASDHNTTVLQCTVMWMNTSIKGGFYIANVSYTDMPNLRINLSNNFTVSENQPVNFTCHARGNPVPTLKLSNSNNNTPLSVMSSPLSYSVSRVRCEDTAIYICFASNSLGTDTQSSAGLFVNCKPRIIPGLTSQQELSPVMYMNKSEQQVFTVVAYPSPNISSFLFLGSDRNLTTISDTTPTNIYLNVTCAATQPVYMNKCYLTVDNVTSSTVGFYQVTIGNRFGSEKFTFEVSITALRMDPCGLDSTLEIIEDRENTTVVCSGLKADNLTWVLETNNTNIASYCPWPPENNVKDTCVNIIQPQVFSPRRTSANESILIINPTLMKNTSLWTVGNLSCQTKINFKYGCQLDLVYSAQGSCSVEFRRESRPWTVHGTCSITKAYSARGRYRCQWYQSLGVSSEKPIGTFVIMSTESYPVGEKYVSGLCQMPSNIAMPMEEGNYNYKVTIIPGMVHMSANVLPRSEIWRPSRPSISCSPGFYVPENKNITCTCNTQSVGVPGGRLQWSLSRNNSFSVINTGRYDMTNLEMLPQNLSLLDHDMIQIRCDVEWAEIILGETHNVFMGHTPSQSEMKLNLKTEDLSVSEKEDVTFECQSNGRPNPNISLINQDKNRQLSSSTSPLFYNLSSVQCEDTGTYACVASNGMGEDKTIFSKLYVKCKPRGISGTIPPEQLSPMTFMGQPVQQTFTVIAYPSPNNFTVTFLGSGRNACECEAMMKGVILNMTYIQTENLYFTNVTLKIFNITSDTAFGFYRIRLSNEFGHDDFVFEIKQSQSVCNQDEKDILARGIGIGVGVGLGVMLAVDVIIIIVVWTWRQQVVYCGDKASADSTYEMTAISNAFQNNIGTPHSIPEDNSKTNENQSVETTLHPSAYQQDNEKLYSLPDDESSEVYAAMQKSDIGVMSSYTRLDEIETITDTLREYPNKEETDILSHLETTTII